MVFVQIAATVEAALEKMRAAGITLVPFDSSPIDEAHDSAWPGYSGTDPEAGIEVALSTSRFAYSSKFESIC